MACLRALLAALLVLAVAILAAGQLPPVCEDPAAYSSAKDYFPAAFKLDVFVGTQINTAQDFSVQYSSSFKTVFNSKENETYVLYECGTPKPNNLPNTTKVFQIPLTTFGTDSTVPVAFIELLGAQGSLSYIDTTYVTSPCIQNLTQSNGINSFSSNKTVRAGQEAATGAVFVANLKPSYNPYYVSFDASSDPGPLKRAEWIKFLALFFNKELEAKAIYDQIATTYACQSAAVVNSTSKPLVAWVSYYSKIWTIEGPAYKLQLVTDAGGKNLNSSLFKDYNMSNPTDVTAFQAALTNVDVVLDDSYAASPSTYTLTNFTTNLGLTANNPGYPFLTNARVWRNDRIVNANGGIAWFESALAQPQLVLQDLISIFYPVTYPNATKTFFRNVAAGEPIFLSTANSCTRANATLPQPVGIVPCPIASAQGVPGSSPNATASGAETLSGRSVYIVLVVVGVLVGLAL